MALTIPIFAFAGVTVSTAQLSLTTGTAGPVTNTTPGMYQPFLAVPATALSSDVFEVRFYETVNSIRYLFWSATFRGTGVAFCWVGPAIMLGVGWDIDVIQLAGVDRIFAWHIAKAA